jgi:hypothetical protein
LAALPFPGIFRVGKREKNNNLNVFISAPPFAAGDGSRKENFEPSKKRVTGFVHFYSF